MTLTENFKSIADKMLSEFGFNIKINSYVDGEFNIETGEKEKTKISFDEKATFLSFQKGEFLESSYTVEAGDLKIICTSNNTLIDVFNTITIDNKEYVIKNIQSIKLKLDDIIYKIIIREKK